MQNAGAIGVVVMNQKPFRYEGDLLSIMNNATELPEAVALLREPDGADHDPECIHRVCVGFRHPLSPESGCLCERYYQ